MIGVLTLVWGSTYFVIRQGLDDLPPFTSAALRFTVAAAVMAVLAHRLAAKEGGRAPSFGLSATMGLCNFGISYGIVYWAETKIPSGLVSVLWGTFPMLLALASQLFRVDARIAASNWAGFLLGFVGVALLFSTDLASLGAGAVSAGAITLLSPAVSALGQVRIKRDSAEVSSLLLNRNAMTIGAVVLWTAALGTERDASWNLGPRAIGSVLYLAILGTVLTFGLYYWAMRTAPAWKLSVIAYLTPALALLLGHFGRGEPVGLSTVGGLAAILAGVALVLRGNRAQGRSYPHRPVEERPAASAAGAPLEEGTR